MSLASNNYDKKENNQGKFSFFVADFATELLFLVLLIKRSQIRPLSDFCSSQERGGVKVCVLFTAGAVVWMLSSAFLLEHSKPFTHRVSFTHPYERFYV